ncbi:MAG: SAV_2336 N-terminal domain-related protein [Chloroflexota bacterium]
MSDLSSIEDPITFFQARKPDLTVEEVLDSLWLLDCIAKYEPLAQKVENSPLTPATPSSSPTEKTNSAGKERQGSSPFDALPPSPPEPLVKVHLPSPQPTALGSAGGGGLPYRSQAVETLPQALLFNRALRLFKRTVKSRRYMVLDEEATIKRIADTAQEIWLPQLKPEIEKWLEVAVIVDLNSTMLLWHKSVDLFSRLLARHGAFRRVTFWGMDQDEAGVYFQLQGRDKQNSRQRQGLPGAGGGKQLIFVVSDCLSPAWQNGAVGRLLKNWQEHHLVSLIQVLPEWLWERTALGSAEKVFLSAREPVLTNRGLQPDSLSAALPKTVL